MFVSKETTYLLTYLFPFLIDPMRLVHNSIFGKTQSFDRFSAKDVDYV